MWHYLVSSHWPHRVSRLSQLTEGKRNAAEYLPLCTKSENSYIDFANNMLYVCRCMLDSGQRHTTVMTLGEKFKAPDTVLRVVVVGGKERSS